MIFQSSFVVQNQHMPLNAMTKKKSNIKSGNDLNVELDKLIEAKREETNALRKIVESFENERKKSQLKSKRK